MEAHTIPRTIRRLRLAQGLTQEEVARARWAELPEILDMGAGGHPARPGPAGPPGPAAGHRPE